MGQGWNEDGQITWKLCFLAQLCLHYISIPLRQPTTKRGVLIPATNTYTPTNYQMPRRHKNLSNRGDRSPWYQDKKAPQKPLRSSPQVQHTGMYTKKILPLGGRDLEPLGVRAAIQDEPINIQEYIRKMAPTDELLNEWLRLLKPREREDIEKSYQCLEKAGLRDSTEVLMKAAEEKALSPRVI